MREDLRIRMNVSDKELADFCQRWKITELSVFGSVLRDDFGPHSDIDLLVKYDPEAQWSLFDHIGIETRLASLVGRDVDLVSKEGVERSDNWIRRGNILGSAELVYES